MTTNNKYTLIDAMYINTSGGKKLLDYLLYTISENLNYNKYILIIDERYKSIYLDKYNHVFIIKPGELSRIRIYFLILKKFNITKIFTFNNLPPPFKIQNHIEVNIYFHNLFLIYTTNIYGILYYLKFIYIKLLNRNHYNWIVQTEFTKKILNPRIKNCIEVIPFYDDTPEKIKYKIFDFIYVADVVIQKNHQNLLEAWNLLADKGIFPSLILTINDVGKQNKFLIKQIKLINSKGGNIINIGFVNYEILKLFYKQTYCLIYPSYFESFGLPLLEAINFNMTIVGSDLEYLNDLIFTEYLFDPFDFNSIANCVLSVYNKQNELTITRPKITNNIFKLLNKI
jgi:glycosyltransferase involved in cell wall biosynthesis